MMTRKEFFRRLDANNNRQWFASQKPVYESLRARWIDGIDHIRDAIVDQWPEVARWQVKTFRIYRDTRFSSDKTPYKTHIGSVIAPQAEVPAEGLVCPRGFYFEDGIPEGDSGVYVGAWTPDSVSLRKLRHAVVDNIEEFNEIISDPLFRRYFPEWAGDKLKTSPKGWPADHPQIELLRLKALGRMSLMSERDLASSDWPDLMARRAVAAIPFMRFIDYSVLEEL